MAFLNGKTPISFLQELCTKREISVTYCLVEHENIVQHAPVFIYNVQLGDNEVTGQGPSKRKAKHNAAMAMLHKILHLPNEIEIPVSEDTSREVELREDAGEGSEGEGTACNFVGELQEMTQQRLCAPPVYEFKSRPEQEDGKRAAAAAAVGGAEFVCTVRLLGLKAAGSGRSKRIAKRDAAFKMLMMLKRGTTLPSSPRPVSGEEEEEEEREASLRGSPRRRLAPLTEAHCDNIRAFYDHLRRCGGNRLQSLHANNLRGITEFYEMLTAIAQEQKFDVTFADIPLMDTAPEYQCLVQLSTMPVAVCHGRGKDQHDAQTQAARNALLYLNIMTKC